MNMVISRAFVSVRAPVKDSTCCANPLAEYARAKAEARQKALVDAEREAQNDYIN